MVDVRYRIVLFIPNVRWIALEHRLGVIVLVEDLLPIEILENDWIESAREVFEPLGFVRVALG